MKARRSSIAGVAATLIFHLLIVVALMLLWLRYRPASPSERKWPPVDSSEVLFGGEYVMTGDVPVADEAPQASEAPPAQDAPDGGSTDAVAAPAPAPVLTSETPSPAKAPSPQHPQTPNKTTPSHTTPATPSPSAADIEARDRQAREQQVRDDVAARMKFARGNQGATDASSSAPSSSGGKPGQANGNASSGALSGQPGVSLHGRTLASWQQPAAGPMGTITIRVTVNRQGQVTDASYSSGTGPAATSTAARTSCLAAARASRFSVDASAPVSQTGTITYHFR